MEITKRINAKINLSLNVLSKENSGFHCLDMITASVKLSDAVTIRLRKDNKITVNFLQNSSIKIPQKIPQKNNSAFVAAQIFQQLFCLSGMDIFIEKNIPLCLGFGGSSADAAGVVLGLIEMLSLDKSAVKVALMTEKLGSDTAAMLEGGFLRVLGRGEITKKIKNIPQLFTIIAGGKKGVLSGEAYANFDAIYSDFCYAPSDNVALIDALKANDLVAAAQHINNALYKPSVGLNPEIDHTMTLLKRSGALAVNMSGSGAGCFGLYASEAAALSALEYLQGKLAFVAYAPTEQAHFVM